ncbi:MAG: pseudaminic acid biosynthesis-associated methylase [Candidatus Caenarcaniphilales bacterium]|nr:pseudaminic acid biosynthesis-associated methylase [Candidatus Caenarcaniphilales bacterium]
MYKTEQEDFWAGDFGSKYIERNDTPEYLASSIAFFTKILNKTRNVSNIIEFGANIGLNLKAIKALKPESQLTAVEINEQACKHLEKIDYINTVNDSILNYESTDRFDMSFVKGVLIHINPDILDIVYSLLYTSSKKYIMIAEYYNPTPVSISYRGYEKKLFKRDFAGEIMDLYSDLRLIDYGFIYYRDNNFSQDDITWFLLEKI